MKGYKRRPALPKGIGSIEMQRSEIQAQLKNGTIPENGEIDVATGDVIIAYANELADRLDACANSGVAGVSDFAATLRLISWCYPICQSAFNRDPLSACKRDPSSVVRIG
jgi:hypothetical protein